MKKLIAIVVLALASLSVVSAKSYDISISSPTKAGSVQLQPGDYKLKVDGTKATFTEINSQKSFTTPVKVEANDKKYSDTKIEATKEGGTDSIKEIDLGGSTTKLGF